MNTSAQHLSTIPCDLESLTEPFVELSLNFLKEFFKKKGMLSCSREFHGNWLNLLKPTGYVMHQQFNIQQVYALPTLYLCVLYLSENKHRLVPLTA